MEVPASQSASPIDRGEGKFACHRCWKKSKRAKDMKRHVVEICEVSRKWKCPEPGCTSEFNRIDRFRSHHRKQHRCTGHDECIHADRAMSELPKRILAGCGYCETGFYQIIYDASDRDKFLNHLVCHYKEGASQADWTTTKQLNSLLKSPGLAELWTELYTATFAKPIADCPQPRWQTTAANLQLIDKLEFGALGLPDTLAELMSSNESRKDQDLLQLPLHIGQPPFGPMLTGFGIDENATLDPNLMNEDLALDPVSVWNPSHSHASTLVAPVDGLGAKDGVAFTQDEYDDNMMTLEDFDEFDMNALSEVPSMSGCTLLCDMPFDSASGKGYSAQPQWTIEHDHIEHDTLYYPPFNPTPPLPLYHGHKRLPSGNILRGLLSGPK